MADIMEDLQIIKSILLRGALNNLYLTNNQMIEVPAAAVGDDTIADLLSRGPGSLVRTEQAGMIREIPVQGIMPDLFAFIELLDGEKENRSGVTRYNQGLDANSLNKTATGIQSIQRAAEQRIELIARIFAETGVSALFRDMHDLVRRYSEKGKAETVRLRGKWVDIEPSSFSRRMDMDVNVGLGTGAKEQKAAWAMQNMQIQQQIMAMQGGPGGIVSMKNVYASLKDWTETGSKVVDRYYTDPDSPGFEMPQPRPDPKAQEAEGKMQMAQAEMQAKQQQLQAEMAMKQQAAQIEQQAKTEAAAADLQLKREVAQMEQQRKDRTSQEDNARKNMETEAQIAREERELVAKMEIERFEAEQKVEIARAEFQLHLETVNHSEKSEAEIASSEQ